ncbi:energy-coupling factor transporter transmembrane protein EcfT [Paenibacillus profundus]|uniref:Energy-coupling factor transporter transmembrane protein EcfT n=1 Tax=Paenibacillus profundus TaxID=1173085 RepID=A0ABS8YE71_9BACL|nr:energy-coupling factor transporter transmembrane component T [Paenibacillus profundus]MCE5168636.1 energy-coupling factor transporter transmembrane protein EcfT [Paenibacillus profundus]
MRTWLLNLDPITKGIWLLSTGLAAIVTLNLSWQSAWFGAVLAIGLSGADWSLGRWGKTLLWLLGFGLPLFLFQWLVLPGETPWLRAGGLVLTAEAYRDSLTLTLRAMTLFLSSLLYASTTAPRDVVVALSHHMRLPDRFAFAVAIALRFVPLLTEEAARIRHAQRMRQLAPPRGLGERLGIARRYGVTVAANALRHVQEVATAMEVKRFGAVATRTHWRRLRFAPAGIGVAAASVVAAAATCLFG